MSPLRLTGLLPVLLAAACAPFGKEPSLSPRPAEAIDPRLPVVDRSGELPADPRLAAEISALRDRAIVAAAAVEPALQNATLAVAAAGARESESWVAAQQLVSAAIAARAPFARALGDFDVLLAERIRGGRRLVPQDLAMVQRVAEQLGAIDRRQAGEIAALERRLQP